MCTQESTWVSWPQPLLIIGRIGRSIRREMRVSGSFGRPSRFRNPLLNTGYPGSRFVEVGFAASKVEVPAIDLLDASDGCKLRKRQFAWRYTRHDVKCKEDLEHVRSLSARTLAL